MAVIGLRVAQLGADLCRGLTEPRQFHRRQPPRIVDMRRGVGHGIGGGRGDVTGVAGNAFGSDPALARAHIHAVHRVRPIAQRLPHRLALFAYMAVGAARVRGDGKDPVPSRQPLDAVGIVLRDRWGGQRQRGTGQEVLHAKSTDLERGSSRIR
jgi:hypothetical protein